MDLTLAFRFILAVAIGMAIGIEREMNEKKGEHNDKPSAILGVRTFTLVTLLGGVVGVLYPSFLPLALLLGAAFFVLLIVFYMQDVALTKDPGITTEIALIYSFIIGTLLTLNVISIQLTLAITVVVLLFLSQKDFIKKSVRNIQHNELNAFISFMIIAIVILPFLPNTSYALQDIPGIETLLKNFGISSEISSISLINPFKIWLYVALITGIDLFGYFLERISGSKKSWLIASIAGGFVSSTATTQSLAQESKTIKQSNHLLSAAVASNTVSFLQIAILIASLNPAFFINLLPILISMIIAGLLSFFYFIYKEKKTPIPDTPLQKETTNIINLKSALTFAGMFILISIISKLALELLGEGGFLITTGLGAFIGLDAVMINTSQLAGQTIALPLALGAFIIANGVNLIAKTCYSYFLGSKEFTVKFGLSVLLIIAGSIVGYILAV